MWDQLLKNIEVGDFKSLARSISLVENEVQGYEVFLQSLPVKNTAIVGITGPPGAGKSTLTDALIEFYVNGQKKVGVICVDPSSPFNLGALLGDRIRMSDWYNHPAVFIRSLASRGSMGGLHPKIIEVSDIMKAAGFDIIFIETVGVGQTEIEIAGLADVTVVVLVPESGDEIQTMKAGLMEVADIFVVNKADRPGAETFIKNLKGMLSPSLHYGSREISVVKTIASNKEGIDTLAKAIKDSGVSKNKVRKNWLLAEKIYRMIQVKRMKDIDRNELLQAIEAEEEGFNIYSFINHYC
jgi:LAO/AO transport system kinase